MKVFHLKFNKGSDGCWYIDFPGYPFDHHNLMMVAGANLLCQYVAGKEGHPDYAVVDVTTGDHLIGGLDLPRHTPGPRQVPEANQPLS